MKMICITRTELLNFSLLLSLPLIASCNFVLYHHHGIWMEKWNTILCGVFDQKTYTDEKLAGIYDNDSGNLWHIRFKFQLNNFPRRIIG